ncbi:MAG: hypothetical protein AB7K52_09955 [Phycisphaerales bacterium]
MHCRNVALSAAAIVAATGSWASAQTTCVNPPTNCITNPSFESPSPFGGGSTPDGWTNHSDSAECIYRQNGVSVPGSPDVTARTGTRCVQVTASPSGGFRSFSTDLRNFFVPNFPFYDVMIDWNGGDYVVEGWFMIPESTPIMGNGFASIKFTLKGAADPNQDNVSVDAWGLRGPTLYNISGHTCGEWVQFRAVLTQAEAHQQFIDNGFSEAIDGMPNRLKPVLGMWFFGEIGSGTIFWDDIVVRQVQPGEPTPEILPPLGSELCPPSCLADFNQDGSVDPDDLGDFINCYFSVPPCDGADINGDLNVDPDDLGDFINIYFGGC